MKLFRNILCLFNILLLNVCLRGEDIYHPADTDNDWHLSESEMAAYVSSWQKGDADISDTIRGLYLSTKFESYKYDASRPRPLCWLSGDGGQSGGGETGINRALIVGINQYLYTNSLYGCVNDANGVRDMLLLTDDAWSVDNVTVLMNSSATLNAVRSQMRALAASSHAGDTVLFAQSSHGGSHSGTNCYMCEYDSFYEDYQLAEDLAEFDDDVNVVLIIDTCSSGGLFKGEKGASPITFAESVMNHYRLLKANRRNGNGNNTKESFGSNIAFMTASDYYETSSEGYYFHGRRFGLYIGHLLEATYTSRADTNNDGRFQLMELHQYAVSNIDPNEQHPQYLNADLLNSISFAGNVRASKSSSPLNTSSVTRAYQHGIWQSIKENLITIEVSPDNNVNVWGLEEILPEGVTIDYLSEDYHSHWDAESRRLTWWGTGSATLSVTVSGKNIKKQLQCKANGDGTYIDLYGDFTLYLPDENNEEPGGDDEPGEQGSFLAIQSSQGYLSGKTCVITYRFDISAMEIERFALRLPTGWTYHSDTLENCSGGPQEDSESSRLVWVFDTPATTTLDFSICLNVPADFEGTAELSSWVYANEKYIPLKDNPLNISSRMKYHSADSNKDGRISLDELLQVIRLYNYEVNHERTGEYHSDPGNGIDDFAPGPFEDD